MMKNMKLSSLIFAIFLLLAITNQSALASGKDFVLTTTDKSETWQGHYESAPFAQAKIIVNIHQSEYVGTGKVNKSAIKEFAYGMKSNRGVLPNKLKKQLTVELVNAEDKKLSCELTMLYSKLWGQCTDSLNEKTFLISPDFS